MQLIADGPYPARYVTLGKYGGRRVPGTTSTEKHRRRQAWFDPYLSTILDRDRRNARHIQDLTAVPRLLALLAARIGTLKNQSEISGSSGISNSTL